MPRQTAFPGIWIDSMKIEGMAPPEGGFVVESNPRVEEGIMEEAVERGLAREFDALRSAAEFSSDTVGEFIRDAESRIGPFLDGFLLTYNLKVRSNPEVTDISTLNKLNKAKAERIISARVRAYVRAKNPFEPDVFEVTVPKKDRALSGDGLDVYDVSVTVTK